VSGVYNVYLYVWEDNVPQTFSLSLEGKSVQANGISGSTGSWKKPGPFRNGITDGTINVAATGGDANFSGIEVY
jgi:hypothetical protein